MAPSYKITYFDARGIVEPLRYIFAYKGVKYVDNRIKREDWPSIKADQPFEKLPVLEVDGKVLAESQAIFRFVSKELGLQGKTNFESALCDMYMDALKDALAPRRQIIMETDEAKKEELKKKFFHEQLPPFLEKLEKFLTKNGGKHFSGSDFTSVDFAIGYALREVQNGCPTALDKYPNLKAITQTIHDIPEIKAWVEKRPKTEF